MTAPDVVVVVGGGIVGAACAYLLARDGASVQLHERSHVAAGTSSACEGNIIAWDKEVQFELPLARRSAELWPAIARELPIDVEYERKGSIVVAETDEELAASAERAGVLAAAGVHGELLDAAGLQAEEPHAARDLPGGVLYPGDAQVEPRLATAALARAATEAGATIVTGSPVASIVRGDDGRVRELRTARGSVPCGSVVVAAGVWTPSLLASCGLAVPVSPRKGIILVTARSAVVFRRKLSEAGYVTAVESDAAARPSVAMVVESTATGTTLVGSSREHGGHDQGVDLGLAAAIARRARRFFPVLERAEVIRIYSGLRPFSPDHLPIIGPMPGAPNLLVATGHEGAGIGLAPATAEIVAALVAGAAPPVDPAPFSPDRFAERPDALLHGPTP